MSKIIMYLAIAALYITVDALPTSPSNVDALVPEVDFAEKGTAADTAADFAPAWSVCKETDECKEAKPAQDSDYQATFDKCFEGGMIEGSGCFKCKKCIDDNLVNENKPHGGMKHSGCFQCKKCIDDETAKEHNAGSTTMSLDQKKVVNGGMKHSIKKVIKKVKKVIKGTKKVNVKKGTKKAIKKVIKGKNTKKIKGTKDVEEMLMQETPEGGFTGGVEKDFAPAWNKCKDTACKDAEQVGGFGPTLKYCLGR